MVRHSTVARMTLYGLALLTLTGATAPQAPAASRNGQLTASQLNGELDAGYRITTGDKLKVTVFDEPSLSGEYQIGMSGALSMPLIEAIPAAGHTPQDIEGIIGEKLKAGGYVLAPHVTVEIELYHPFYILGEVKLPGEYPFNGDMTFEQAVARAGGFTPRANRRTIFLKRQSWQVAQRVKLDGPALKIAPGDTITVRESLF